MFHVKPWTPEAFGKRLLQARLDAGARRGKQVTQTEVADKLGVSQVTVGRWESGAAQPDLPTLQKIAAVLGVDPAYLAFGPAVEDEPVRQRKVR